MRHLTIFITFLSVFSSCTKETEEITTTNYDEKWTLVKMSGSLINSVSTGVAMEWQEYYLLKNDGTFSKSRIRNEVETKVSGTYTIIYYQDKKHLELTYPIDNDIIGNCSGDLKEELYFTSNNTLSSTWSACDGPGLEYLKVD
jgi:hypothetical protein